MSPPWTERLDALPEVKCFYPGAVAFNAPFDCWPYGALPDSRSGFEAAQAPFIATLAENERRDIPANYAIQWMTKKFASKSIKDIHDGVQRALRMAADATDVFCLAACIESTLMWSHYASSHAGIALRFDFSRQRRGGVNPIWKVRYEKERPVLPTLQVGRLGDLVPRASSTTSPAAQGRAGYRFAPCASDRGAGSAPHCACDRSRARRSFTSPCAGVADFGGGRRSGCGRRQQDRRPAAAGASRRSACVRHGFAPVDGCRRSRSRRSPDLRRGVILAQHHAPFG